MSDIIKLLPDSVANQIAAGEVIQRPASAVKELMENAIDAGATQLKLIIKDAGKTLIQVVDNGAGMTETDARLCFERHATSKIREASDLFNIRTMGFRGEALASIAAISRVELKSRTPASQMGTEVIIEGSVTESQMPCQCPVGTSIAVKNLFYNTPARRNFLKSDQIEKGHIFNEFVRIALANPAISFQYFLNGQLTNQLDKGNLKQRIVSLFGNHYLPRLVPVEEKTDLVSLFGFVLKPEFAKKRRGEQYIYVNNRYIRSAYLGHAIEQAFQELIPDDAYPSFYIFIETDPAQLDVNVHPAKTEIKFQDERFVYQVLKTAVKRALGRYNVSPTLDFERETSFDDIIIDRQKPVKPPHIQIDPSYNPFQTGDKPAYGNPGNLTGRANPKNWEMLFAGQQQDDDTNQTDDKEKAVITTAWTEGPENTSTKKILQLQQKYILAPVKSGLMVIDQQRAHERILFERFLRQFDNQQYNAQQLLFPETIILTDQDADTMREMLPVLGSLGFEISEVNKRTFILNAIPADLVDKEPLQDIIEGLIEQYGINRIELQKDIKTNTARSLAKRMAIKQGKRLTEEEMITLTEALFACQVPYQSPGGKPCVSIMGIDELAEKFR